MTIPSLKISLLKQIGIVMDELAHAEELDKPNQGPQKKHEKERGEKKANATDPATTKNTLFFHGKIITKDTRPHHPISACQKVGLPTPTRAF